jgi:predicted dehydrogenase
MIRIGIVGSDNSHAIAFSQLMNTPKSEHDPRWSDARVVALYGTDPARNAEVAEKGNIPHLAGSVEELLDRVDAAMVVWRHGDLHREAALPFLRAGKPVFVDKPFAIKLEDCQAMLDAARESGALLTSYSTTRFSRHIRVLQSRRSEWGDLRLGQMTGPADLQSEYGGVFFYANHAIEMMLTLWGEEVETVTALEGQGNVSAVVRWQDGRLCNLNLCKSAKSTYAVTLHGTDGWVSEKLDTSSCYNEGLAEFIRMIRTGQRPLTDEQMVKPIRIMHAFLRSLKTGHEERI